MDNTQRVTRRLPDKALVLTPMDEVEEVEFNGQETIEKVLEADASEIGKLFDKEIELDELDEKGDYKKFPTIIFGLRSKAGYYEDTCCDNKVNALATFLYGYPVFGNAIVVIPCGNNEVRGMTDIEFQKRSGNYAPDTCETLSATSTFCTIRNMYIEDLKNIHSRLDNRKEDIQRVLEGKENPEILQQKQ